MEENNIYMDGGLLANYPKKQCILNGAEPDDIIGLYKINNIYIKNIDEKGSFFDYILGILTRIFDKMLKLYEGTNPEIKHEYFVRESAVSINSLSLTASSMEERKRLIKMGVDIFHGDENP